MALPLLTNKQKLTSTTWNATMAEIEARLAAISGPSMAWPLVAGGNINMDQLYTIIGMQNLWSVINASEYDTLDDAIADAVGGGIVYVPSNLGTEAWAKSTGVSLASNNITIVGAGPDSIIALTSGSGPLITTPANTARSGIGLFNLTIDTAGGAADAVAVQARYTDRFQMGNVKFTGIKGKSVVLTHDGTAGNSCTNATLDNLYFSGGSGTVYNIYADDINGLQMSNIRSATCPTIPIYMLPATSASSVANVDMYGVYITSPSSKGVSILGNSGASGDQWSNIMMSDVTVVSPGAVGIEVGSPTKVLKNVCLNGCHVLGTVVAGGIVACSDGGSITDCTAPNAGTYGLDITSSLEVFVTSCNFKEATTYGVIAVSTTDCAVTNNNLRGCLTGSIDETSATRLMAFGNVPLGNAVAKKIAKALANPGDDGLAWSYTIPAHTLNKAGDGIIITAAGDPNSNANVGELYVRLNTIQVGAASTSTNYNVVLTSWVFVNSAGLAAASNTEYMYSGLNENGVASAGTATITVDWTAAVTLDVYMVNAAGQQMIVTGVHVQFIEGSPGGTVA